MMIFRGPYPLTVDTIILPSPSLNDIRRLTVDQIIKRNLDQNIITYVSRNISRQWNWQFILSVAKRWELYYFLREHKSQQIQAIDHKDKLIVGYFINGTDTFTDERRGNFRSKIYDNLTGGDVTTEEVHSLTVDFVGNYL